MPSRAIRRRSAWRACKLFDTPTLPALERGWSLPVGFDAGWGFNVVFAVHLSGAITGALLALGLNTLASMRPARRHQS